MISEQGNGVDVGLELFLADMLELEVVPEHGLQGEAIEFLLGMHFSVAVASVQQHVGHIKAVEISYCDRDPLSYDLTIKLTKDGIKLVFDSISQRLKVIEVYDLSLVRLKYSDLMFNCPDVSPTIEQIDQSFGATRPGVYDEERRRFTLTFRGLAFEFPAETKFQPSYGGSRRELGRLQFPPGQSPTVSHMSIYSGPSMADCTAPPSRLPTLEARKVEVVRRGGRTVGVSVLLAPHPGELARSCLPGAKEDGLITSTIRFGDSVQDVMAGIGAPSKVFYKSEDKMKIHSPNAHRRSAALRSDYFYNYFTIGMDILFDAKNNKVKKFILHTNFPGHYNFNMYHRCQFNLSLPTSSSRRSQGFPPAELQVTSLSKWDSLVGEEGLLKPSERPVVLNRASSTNTTNPFGSTFCYGYQDIIFEVMPNGHIASVSLYLPPGQSPKGEADL